jgi:hypothetical protein
MALHCCHVESIAISFFTLEMSISSSDLEFFVKCEMSRVTDLLVKGRAEALHLFVLCSLESLNFVRRD